MKRRGALKMALAAGLGGVARLAHAAASDWEQSFGYPSGWGPRNDWNDKTYRVGNYSGGYERMLRARAIRAAGEASPLQAISPTGAESFATVAGLADSYMKAWPSTGLLIAQHLAKQLGHLGGIGSREEPCRHQLLTARLTDALAQKGSPVFVPQLGKPSGRHQGLLLVRGQHQLLERLPCAAITGLRQAAQQPQPQRLRNAVFLDDLGEHRKRFGMTTQTQQRSRTDPPFLGFTIEHSL